MWRVEVRNEAALLNTFGRPALLVANHTSHLDFIVLNALFKKRYGSTITFLAKRELWDSRLWRLLIRYGNAIPVDRAQFSIGTLRAMKGVLAGGHFMGMFPEGTRSEDGLMGPIKPGLEFIARLHPDMVYVPCGLVGFHEAWPKDRSMRLLLSLRHRLVTAVGEPCRYDGSETPADFARRVMTEVATQSNQPAPRFEGVGDGQKRSRKTAA